MFRRKALLITIVALSAVMLACLPLRPAKPEVVSVNMAKELTRDYKPVKETTEFLPTEPFNCSVRVSNLPKGAEVKAVWFYGEELIEETSYTTDKAGSGYIGFTLEPENYWPIGKYRVKIYLEDQYVQEVGFSVVPPADAIPSRVKKVVMAKEVDENQKPVKIAKTFYPYETVYCSVNVDLGVYSRLEARWYHEGELQEDWTTTIVAEENVLNTYVSFYLEPDPALPEGEYKVELYLDGNLARTATFSVVEEAVVPAGMKLYSSESLGFSILYPSDWDVLEEADHVSFQPTAEVVLSVGVLEDAEDTPQKIAEVIVDSLKADYSDLEVSYSGPFSISGIEWWEVDLSFVEEGREKSSILLVTVQGDRAYLIVTLAPAEEEEQWLGYFVDMVASFKIK
ncbi:MAG: hypothetical protein RMK30_09190 [Anaerolineae bacterium]|nr:hypothetical protein [Anaerolineae bacterium]MDW8103037.1 hypothetical protein [Anaerolineae bacterium]